MAKEDSESAPTSKVKLHKQKGTSHKTQPKVSSIIDIYMVSANVIYFYAKKPGSEMFITTLHEIDKLLEDRIDDLPEDEETEYLLDTTLPKPFQINQDTFSKRASHILLPHRPYDHKIVLNEPLPNNYLVLYWHSTEEL